MYNKTITLFNRYESIHGDLWFSTVIREVDLNIDKASITAKYGAESQDNAILHIKYRRNSDGIYIEDKKYLPPKEWDRQLNDNLDKTITFTGGQSFDFFIEGEYTEEVIKDNDYLDGFYDYINNRYDNVFAITSVAIYEVIPHFEIMGK